MMQYRVLHRLLANVELSSSRNWERRCMHVLVWWLVGHVILVESKLSAERQCVCNNIVGSGEDVIMNINMKTIMMKKAGTKNWLQ